MRFRRDKAPEAPPARLERATLEAALAELGPAGVTAERLEAAAAARAESLRSLSELTSRLAIEYLERIGRVRDVSYTRPTKPAELRLAHGVAVTTAGYAAHVAVETDPAAFGVTDVPVLGTLPDPRGGRPPQDLLLRVVKTTRRPFPSVRAVNDEVWSGLVDCATWRAHTRAGPDELPLDRSVVDALLRFGWVLRQVDLHYGLAPEETD